MKILRNILILIIILIITIIIAFDSIVKFTIQHYGTDAVKTEVVVGNIDSDLIEKNLIIENVAIHNPDGFSGNIFSLDKLNIKINNIKDNLIVIDNFALSGINANILQNEQKINIIALKDEFKTNNTVKEQSSISRSKSENRLLIKNFKIDKSKIIINTKFLQDEIIIPTISIKNFGGESGVRLDNIFPYLINFLIKEIEKILKTQGINTVKGRLEEGLIRQVNEELGINVKSGKDFENKLKDELKNKTDKLKNIFKF